MRKPLRIYIAGPYSAIDGATRQSNVQRAMDAGISLYLMGHFPYVPHLTHFIDERANSVGIHLKWEDYIRWDTAWLEVCDAILYLGASRGADIELDVAKKLGKQVFYSISEIPNLIEASDSKFAK